MIFVEIGGWANSPEPMSQSAVRSVAQALQDQDLGSTEDLVRDLQRAPARVGPFDSFTEAESVSRLLMGFGALSLVVEDG